MDLTQHKLTLNELTAIDHAVNLAAIRHRLQQQTSCFIGFITITFDSVESTRVAFDILYNKGCDPLIDPHLNMVNITRIPPDLLEHTPSALEN